MTENPTANAENTDIAAMSYEQAREELVAVVHQLEAGNISLEQSLALWERGEALAARCETWLEGARQRLDAARAATDSGTAANTNGGN
ncbi:exodeoxyribonuclease VII small subunit [Arthrobacter crystallopoietes BAB-32]|uniref:Exodeoxyribonuclease 7 small subunit n=1 Tax=Arthrobacter crystallopoietes BAB-32 TaxID=1246476 RepID=N1V633_9MICC|nr:exodeoxyribonuclease VII small subunit [Arthrobacter crystallopoietes]EMY35474.1 exodeoxyribonuclease VII small subunit [Arthrobacter crystallopoietes BAB-32]